jgi:hypothetical protein
MAAPTKPADVKNPLPTRSRPHMARGHRSGVLNARSNSVKAHPLPTSAPPVRAAAFTGVYIPGQIEARFVASTGDLKRPCDRHSEVLRVA